MKSKPVKCKSDRKGQEKKERILTITEALKSSIEKLSDSSNKAAKLRLIMPEINRCIEYGVKHEEIVEILNSSGLDVTLNTFRGNLYRYRNRKQKRPNIEFNKEPETELNSELDSQGGNSLNGDSDNESLKLDSLVSKNEVSSEVELNDILDHSKRNQHTQKYMKKKSLFGNKK